MATNMARNSWKLPVEHSQSLCDPCRFNGDTTIAMKYCKDCDGNLCQPCVSMHKRGANTKNHIMSFIMIRRTGIGKINMADTQGCKNFDTNCMSHSKQVISYCGNHDSLCCRICIGTIHRECKLKALSEAASGSREGREIDNTATYIKHLKAKFEEKQNEKQANLIQLRQLDDTFANALKTHRKMLNNLLDKLEQAVLKRKDRHYDTKCDEIRDCLKTIQTAIGTLNGSLNTLDIAAQQGDEQAMFLTMKKVQAVTKRFEKVYSDLEKYPKHYTFYFQPDVAVEKFLKGLAELGRVRDDSIPHSGHQTAWKMKYKHSGREPRTTEDRDKVKGEYPAHPGLHSDSKYTTAREALEMASSDLTSDELNVRLQSDKKPCSITGATFLADDKIVVTDATNKKVKVFGADLKPISFLETSSAPRDVTHITSSEAAFTMPNDQSFQIIKIGNTITVKKTIRLDIECYGITHHDNEFFLASGWSTEKEVHVVDTEGELKRILRPHRGILKCPLYVTVDPKFSHVFVSDYENGVVGMDLIGTVIFRFQDTGTKGYMGICASPDSNVYVCTFQPNGVSRVKTDRKLIGSLMTLKHGELEPLITLPNKGGKRPRAVAYNRKSNKVMISFVGQSVDTLSIYHL